MIAAKIAEVLALISLFGYLIFKPSTLSLLYYSGIAFLIEFFMSKPGQYLIIVYHKVSDEPSKYSVSPEIFEKQIKFLKKNFRILKLDHANNMHNLKGRKIVITFDDGYDNNYNNAFRIAKKYNVPIHIFPVSGRVNKKGYLTWKQIQGMQKSGLVLFGNHTRTHPILSDLDAKSIKKDIIGANTDLGEKIGSVKYFCYPFGDRFDSKTIRILQDLKFDYALTWIPGINDSSSDSLQLKRISINDLSMQNKFKLKYPNLFFKLKRR
ncbi:polysaccharide deacetylase family protein [Candidatus Woesearchaeota archaeon]|nr:polysaccharide deacetylase family protein [Candidatus Woesearchaeota archaeon]